MRVLLRKSLAGDLSPTDEEGKTALRSWKAGDELWVEVRKARHPKHHRLYFALLNLVFENQEQYIYFPMFRKAVQMEAGHVDLIVRLDGEAHVIPKSIDYASLDEAEFTKVFNETMQVCLDNFLTGTDERELRAEVEKYAA